MITPSKGADGNPAVDDSYNHVDENRFYLRI